jgi:hypothetical protein
MIGESQIVGMLIAWSVITLESLVNHALAENINNRASAVMAIEYPAKVADTLKISRAARSELAKKVIILSNFSEMDSEIVQLCDELADTRNIVIHDKPFECIDRDSGDVEINHVRSRGELKTFRYDDLAPFFQKCDRLVGCIASMHLFVPFEGKEINFGSLLKKEKRREKQEPSNGSGLA